MPKALRVNGVPDLKPDDSPLTRGYPGGVTVKRAAQVAGARAIAEPIVFEGADDDVVEIELQDGFRIWSRVDDARRDFAARGSRAADDETIDIPSALAIGPSSRALGGGWALKAVKLLGLGDVEGTIAKFGADHVESKLSPGPGLYRCSPDDATRLTQVREVDRSGPVLIFLHGTASSTSGSFGGLWSAQDGAQAKALFEQYGDRVLAYQHRTLSQSPIENALELVTALEQLLPSGSEVHLVSHSRGGMVGELLARGMRVGAAPFTAEDLALLDAKERARDRKALEELSAALQRAALRVTRFVRVACPARGTTLADGRLDRYLSVLVNLAGLAGLAGNPVYEGLTSLLGAVLKKRADPAQLPGLEAMMPTSPLVRLLNDPEVTTSADLHVLGGDLAGTGVFGRLKTLATDFYYRDDHDVVVNTAAMLGGMNRTAPILYYVDTGDQVTHFHYFSRSDTARRLVAALKGHDGDFRALAAPPSTVTAASYIKRAAFTRPAVVVLPGIMGSQLSVGESPVWMNLRLLARGGLPTLAMTAENVKATGLLGNGYDALCKYLADSHQVVPFPYDWRLPLERTAEALLAQLNEVVPLAEQAGQPVRLLAHSMGGLVVRAMLATPEGEAMWQRMCTHPGARFVMLGTPNRGSHAIPAMLMGRDALVKKLALVDFKSTHAQLLATIAAFPGVLNLLPHPGQASQPESPESLDFFSHGDWQRLFEHDAPQARGLFGGGVATDKSAGFRWALPTDRALDAARQCAARLATQRLDPSRTVYIAGHAPETACEISIDPEAREGRRVSVRATRRGDGRVTWDSGIPANVPTYFMDTVHGDLANDRRHFAALLEVLDSGKTARLPTSAPVSRAAERELFEAQDSLPDSLPDEADLMATALGGQRRVARDSDDGRTQRVRVRVVHDNLTNARHPVLVSHYSQDVIVAAEKYLDQRLGGRLSELLQMELYPGPLNTAVVVLNDTSAASTSRHPGAIVVGLGEVGALTPGGLTSTLSHALTLYGSDCVGTERRRQQRLGGSPAGTLVAAPVTAILIGSGEGGVTLLDCVRALLRAVQQANRRLKASTGDTGKPSALFAQIDQLDVIELYEDRAIEAMYAFRTLTASPEFAQVDLERRLVRGEEGLRRARFGSDEGWWQRLRIVRRREDDALDFEAVTRTARAPATLLPTQRGLVDGFIERAMRSTRANPRLGQTLFELLVPNDLKSFAPDRQKLALMLDEQAAALPWELMQDGFDRQPEPLAVASGMVRQLLVQRLRHQVLRATDDTALVVGNPKVSDRRFPSLRGAREEAEAVAAILQQVGKYDVNLLLEDAATPTSVLDGLHERPLRILHLAAHGVFEFEHVKGKRVSGLVLGDGTFFTAAEADQMRYVPELVFINCCFLGKTTGDAREYARYDRLAANLATQFIRMGARAVVAAGWEVDDGAAKTFATSFYGHMLNGQLFGDAVMLARRATYNLHGDTNTWGAYQCYGDVSFSLKMGDPDRLSTEFVSEAEFRLWVEGVPARARGHAQPAELLRELETRVAAAPEEWFESADMGARTGAAYLALAGYEKALGYYKPLCDAEDASAPIAALEQYANCLTKRAEELGRHAGKKQGALDLLDRAQRILTNLRALGETSERCSLLGSVYKRRAEFMTDRADRLAALRQATEAYGQAFELSRRSGARGNTYPLINRIGTELVASWLERGRTGRKPGPKKAGAMLRVADAATQSRMAGLIEQLDTLSTARAGSSTDTYNLLARAEYTLLAALSRRTLSDGERGAIEVAYGDALSRGVTSRQKESLRAQLEFYRRAAEQALPAALAGALVEGLNKLEKAVLPRPS